MNIEKKTFESISKKLTRIMGDYESVVEAASAELEVIDTKIEELERQATEQTRQSKESERVAKNLRKLLEGDL